MPLGCRTAREGRLNFSFGKGLLGDECRAHAGVQVAGVVLAGEPGCHLVRSGVDHLAHRFRKPDIGTPALSPRGVRYLSFQQECFFRFPDQRCPEEVFEGFFVIHLVAIDSTNIQRLWCIPITQRGYFLYFYFYYMLSIERYSVTGNARPRPGA